MLINRNVKRGSGAFSRRYKLSSRRLRRIYIRLHAGGIIFCTREPARRVPKRGKSFHFCAPRLCHAFLGSIENLADKSIRFNDTRVSIFAREEKRDERPRETVKWDFPRSLARFSEPLKTTISRRPRNPNPRESLRPKFFCSFFFSIEERLRSTRNARRIA